MKLTSSVSYAVGILLQVHAKGAAGPITAATIATGCKFPQLFLYRILRRLVDAGLLTGVSGPGGGYALARKPRSISLLHIVSAVEGPPEPSQLVPVTPRHRKAIASINAATAVIAKRSSQQLNGITLERLIRTVPKKTVPKKTVPKKGAKKH